MSELNSLSNRSKILLMLWSLAVAVGFFCWGMFYSKMNENPEITTHTTTNISCISLDTPTNFSYSGDYLV